MPSQAGAGQDHRDLSLEILGAAEASLAPAPDVSARDVILNSSIPQCLNASMPTVGDAVGLIAR